MNESKATRYRRLQRRTHAAGWLLAGFMLAVLAFTPAGRSLHDLAVVGVSGLPGALRAGGSLLLYIALVTALCELAVVPAELYRLRRVDAAYGRSAHGLRGRLAGTVTLLPAVVVCGLLVVFSGRVAAGAWWLLAGLLLSMALVVALRIGPLILGRLGGLRPLSRPALETRIAGLARGAGVPVAAIQEWRVDENAATVAMVAGVGRGRRVLVASEVVQHWSDDEITVVVAHELAHHVHSDLLRALVLNAVIICAGLLASDLVIGQIGPRLGVDGAGDPVALPSIAFITLAVWFLATPLRHAQSRRHERQADRFALSTTGHAEAFVAAVRRASARQLVDDTPTLVTRWLYHRHPSVAERLALAERYQADRSAKSP